jgi:error-prone DNA polymerase
MLFMVRTYFSLLRGCLSPEDAAAMAAERGLEAAVILDRLNFYGLIRFANACRRQGIRPIPGMDISPDPRIPVAVLAAGRRGLSLLNRLVTVLDAREHSRSAGPAGGDSGAAADGGDPASGGESLTVHLDDMLDILSAAEAGQGAGDLAELFFILPGEALVDPGAGELKRLLVRMDRLAGEGYAAGHVLAGILDGRPQRRARQLAAELGIEAVAAVWGSWRDETERRRIDLLRAIDLCVTVPRLPPGEKTPDDQRISTSGEAEGMFAVFSRPRSAATALAASLDGGFLLPDRYVFPGFRGLDGEAAFDRLKQLCHEGVLRRYGAFRDDIRRRLEYELRIIRAKGFASYFLVVHDIVSRTPRTCGRGSSAASIVSYLLGITHVDPLKYRLFFERFLNMGRSDPPDIDVDFPWDERAGTLQYVFDAYPGRSAMVADHVTFGPRSSIREPAKAMGIDDEEISRFIRLWKLGQGDRLPEWLRREALAIRGVPRYLGTHPGGVVITPGPLTDWTHSQISPLGWPVIAWEKDATEDAGLVKIDILGNRSLGVLRDCIDMINEHRGGNLSWEGLDPLEDGETRRFIESGDTLGIFYVESPATRQLLQKMRTGDYPHLVIASSIIRPAANRYINEYVRRLRGGSWDPIDPRAEEVLEETCGIMVYQEDVSRVAIAVSGFDPAEADMLRKILSRKDRDLKLESWRRRFIAGGLAAGGSPAALEELWDMIRSFEGYSFCKPHSASYALVSYKLAWIKRHFPLEFYTAVINNGGGYYNRQTYVNAARRLGNQVLLPDVNSGQIRYSVDYGRRETPLRAGLMQIRGLSASAMERIVAERERGGPFGSFTDFFHRIRPDILQMRSLIRSGALDSCDPFISRPAMFWLLSTLSRRDRAGGAPGHGELFDSGPAPAGIGDYPPELKLRDEAEVLGLFLSVHPLRVFIERGRQLVRRRGLGPHIRSSDIPGYLDQEVYISGYMVSGKEVYTRTHQAMSFISFEDEGGLFETVFFPDAYEGLIEALDSSMVFLIHGTVRQELGAYSIHCINLFPLSRRYSKSTYFSDSFYTVRSMGGNGDRKAG